MNNSITKQNKIHYIYYTLCVITVISSIHIWQFFDLVGVPNIITAFVMIPTLNFLINIYSPILLNALHSKIK